MTNQLQPSTIALTHICVCVCMHAHLWTHMLQDTCPQLSYSSKIM